MDNSLINSTVEHADDGEVKLIGSYIASAMDIEDKILVSSYIDYLDRKSWPAGLDRQAFEAITKYLTLLIKDTRMHQQMFLNLQNRLNTKNEKHS